jgi:long-chain acyl-CoA synthetase
VYPGTYAASAPDRVALIMAGTGETVTYAQLEERSRRLVHVLRAAGLRRGDVIAILSDNDPRVLEIYWAAQRCGLYVSAINHNLAPAEVRYILGDSGAQALFTSARNAGLATAAAPEDLELRWAFGGEVAGTPTTRQRSQRRRTRRSTTSPAAPTCCTRRARPGARRASSRRCRTARSTSRATRSWPCSERYGFDEDTVYLSPAPLYHAAPLRTCITVQSLGGTVVVMDRFDAEGSLASSSTATASLTASGCRRCSSGCSSCPDSVRERYDVSSMQVAIHAAAPCPVSVKQQMMAWWGPVLHEYYSSTEVNG